MAFCCNGFDGLDDGVWTGEKEMTTPFYRIKGFGKVVKDCFELRGGHVCNVHSGAISWLD